MSNRKSRVLILAGGFGGLYAALEFEKRKDPRFDQRLPHLVPDGATGLHSVCANVVRRDPLILSFGSLQVG